MPCPTPIGIRHEVLAFAREGMRESAIAGHVFTLISKGDPWKTTPRQDLALLTIVRQNLFISALALMVRMRNWYQMRAGQKTINNCLVSRSYRAYRPTRKALLTANHRRLFWVQRWQNLIRVHWQHVIFHYESRFQLFLADGRLRLHNLPGEHFQQRCQTYRAQAGGGLVHVWKAFHSGTKSPLVLPDRYLTSELCRGVLGNRIVPLARQHFGNNYCCQDDNATPQIVLDFLQQGDVTKVARLQPCRTYFGWIGPCNNQYGQPRTLVSKAS